MVRQRHAPHNKFLSHLASQTHAQIVASQEAPLGRRADHSEESRPRPSSTPSAATASLDGGDIAGIVIGAVVAAALLVAVGFVWLWLVRRQRFVHAPGADACATNDRRHPLPPGMHELPVDPPRPPNYASDEPAYPTLAGCPAPAPAHTKRPWHAPPSMDDVPQSYTLTGYEHGTGYDTAVLGTVDAASPPNLVALRPHARADLPALNDNRHSLLSWETAPGSPTADVDTANPESPGSWAPFSADLRPLGSNSEYMSSHHTQYHSCHEEPPPSTVYHPAASHVHHAPSFFSA